MNAPPRAVRHKLQEERLSVTHKFKVGDHEGYSPSDFIPTASPANYSSPWRKKDRRSAD